MGQNLILNMDSKGFVVCAYNRTVAKVWYYLLYTYLKNTKFFSTVVDKKINKWKCKIIRRHCYYNNLPYTYSLQYQIYFLVKIICFNRFDVIQ